MVENLSATVENLGELSHFTGKQLVKELLMKLPKYMRMQWGSFLIQIDVSRQNINAFAECVNSIDKIVSAVEIGE
jgi:biotin synthase-related radical SAM superfamily protein